MSSPITWSSISADISTEEPDFVSLQVRDVTSSNSRRSLREEKWATMSSSRVEDSTAESDKDLMKSVLRLISSEISPSLEKTRFPETISTPNPFRIPIPGPDSLLSNPDDIRELMSLWPSSWFLIQSQSLDSRRSPSAAFFPSEPRETSLLVDSSISTNPASCSPLPAPATWTWSTHRVTESS